MKPDLYEPPAVWLSVCEIQLRRLVYRANPEAHAARVKWMMEVLSLAEIHWMPDAQSYLGSDGRITLLWSVGPNSLELVVTKIGEFEITFYQHGKAPLMGVGIGSYALLIQTIRHFAARISPYTGCQEVEMYEEVPKG